MGFQTSVNQYQAPAVAGDLLNDNPVVYHDGTGIAGANGVVAGKFVWLTLTDGQYVGSSIGKGDGTKPNGIVQRVQRAYNYDVASEATMTIGKGQAFSTVVDGEIAVVCTTAATVGQSIYVNEETGAITSNVAGQTAGHVLETPYKVYSLLGNASEANQLVGISKRL